MHIAYALAMASGSIWLYFHLFRWFYAPMSQFWVSPIHWSPAFGKSIYIPNRSTTHGRLLFVEEIVDDRVQPSVCAVLCCVCQTFYIRKNWMNDTKRKTHTTQQTQTLSHTMTQIQPKRERTQLHPADDPIAIYRRCLLGCSHIHTFVWGVCASQIIAHIHTNNTNVESHTRTHTPMNWLLMQPEAK